MDSISAYSAEDERPAVKPVRRNMLMSAYIILLITAMLGPLMTISDLPGLGAESSLRKALFVIVFALVLFALRPLQDIKRLHSIPIPLIVTLAWCWLSLGWAISLPVALNHLILSTVVIWTIFSCVRFLGYEQSLLIFRAVLAAFVVINLVAVLLFPDFAIHQFNEPDDKSLIGDWRGIMMHKNLLGGFAGVAILAFVFDAQRFPMIVRIAVISSAAMLLMGSGSKTSFGMVVGSLAIGYVFLNYSARYRPLALGAIGIACLTAIVSAYVYRNPLSDNLTDPTSFTGRPMIWKAVVDYWLDNPYTGSGFGSFWAIGYDSPIYHYGSGWVTTIFSTHNGYLALLSEVGIPGLVLALYSLIVWPLSRLLGDKAIEGARSALLIAIIFFVIGHNATETSLLDRDHVVNVALMVAIAVIAWGGRGLSRKTFSFDMSQKRS